MPGRDYRDPNDPMFERDPRGTDASEDRARRRKALLFVGAGFAALGLLAVGMFAAITLAPPSDDLGLGEEEENEEPGDQASRFVPIESIEELEGMRPDGTRAQRGRDSAQGAPTDEDLAAARDALAAPEPDDALSQAQQHIRDLESELEGRYAEIEALRGELSEDAARSAEVQKRWDGLQADVAKLEIRHSEAVAERNRLRAELEDVLARLDLQTAETSTAREAASSWRRASNDNLWYAFVNNARARMCDKGTRKAHRKCHDAVAQFLDEDAHTRFVSCVSAGAAMPVLGQAHVSTEVPKYAERLPWKRDMKVPGKGWYVAYCDPTLPEAELGQDAVAATPTIFEVPSGG